jgi:hypothetical protein
MKRQVTSIIMQLEGEKLRPPHYPESNIVGKNRSAVGFILQGKLKVFVA